MQAYFLESVAISLGRYLQLLLMYLQKQVILKLRSSLSSHLTQHWLIVSSILGQLKNAIVDDLQWQCVW